MTNEQYRKMRKTDKPCTAITLPTGNIVKRNRVIEAFELIFVDDTICNYCQFASDSKVCPHCGREKK